MATDITRTRGRRGLPVAAALTVFFFGATQAFAQAPPAAPPPPAAAQPVAAQPTPTSPPSTSPPVPDERPLGDEIPTSVEGPAEPPPPEVIEPPPPEPVPPPEPPPPTPETVTPPPKPIGPTFNDGGLLVKDQAQAQDMRRKGIGVMITGGVITIAGVVTSIAFTVRGTQYESLLLQTEEEYNRTNCSSKVSIKEGSKCDVLGKQVAKNNTSIEFDDRATRVAGAAIAAGVIVTVIGGIIYRLGIKKLRAGEISRMRMQPAIGRGFGGLVLTGRF